VVASGTPDQKNNNSIYAVWPPVSG
jgi:hypothetical protein